MEQSRKILSWLIKQDAATVQSWLNEVWEGKRTIPDGFSWQHLTASIDALARAGAGPDYYKYPDPAWAKVAFSLYQYLLERETVLEQLSLEIKMMHLKGTLISRTELLTEEHLMEAKHIVEWFFQRLYLSVEEASRQSASIETLADDEILRLRYIKERLAIVQFLIERGAILPDEKLKPWLALREKLP